MSYPDHHHAAEQGSHPTHAAFSVHHCADLKPQHRYMLSYLIDNAAEWADQDGWVKFGRRSLAERLCLDHATTRRLIKALEDAGYITVEAGGGAQKYSRYKLHLSPQQGVKNDPVASCNKEHHGVSSEPVAKPDRGNIVPLHPAKTLENRDFSSKQHGVMPDSHRLESDLSSKDSTRIESENDSVIDQLTDLFLAERTKAHPQACPVSRAKTLAAVRQCLDAGVKPDALASNIRNGMLRGKFREDPPSSPLAFKRSAAENWGRAPDVSKPVMPVGNETEMAVLPDNLPAEEQQRLFRHVCKRLRLRSPQKLGSVSYEDPASWQVYIRPDMIG